jgi:hypothetical protein
MNDRRLFFSSTFNTRDLGGIRTIANKLTRFRSIVRSDAIDLFSKDDWKWLSEYGVLMLIDLRNVDEISPIRWPSEFERMQIALDGGSDASFWAAWKETGK